MYDTDKIKHGLIAEYEKIFAPLRNQELNILEMGVYKGGSIAWMHGYFPYAQKIIGLDLAFPAESTHLVHDNSVVYRVCDQNDSKALNDIGLEFGKFDIIIDDGSHRYKETKNTFEQLFKYLKPGGLYIIEDFIAGYWPQYPEYFGLHELVFNIALNKNEHGISDFELILKEPKCSLAVFKKNEA
ncbi:MAG: class I SAM-dependent methyltransferase [Parcubacteria group bacterium]|jgi:demethylmacrocin O-methyltransferase